MYLKKFYWLFHNRPGNRHQQNSPGCGPLIASPEAAWDITGALPQGDGRKLETFRTMTGLARFHSKATVPSVSTAKEFLIIYLLGNYRVLR
jgi:hypothetical protein